jgi:hypothetical protein
MCLEPFKTEFCEPARYKQINKLIFPENTVTGQKCTNKTMRTTDAFIIVPVPKMQLRQRKLKQRLELLEIVLHLRVHFNLYIYSEG